MHYEDYDSFVFVHRQTVLARINKRGLKEDENCVYAQKKKVKILRNTDSVHRFYSQLLFFPPFFLTLNSSSYFILIFFFL